MVYCSSADSNEQDDFSEIEDCEVTPNSINSPSTFGWTTLAAVVGGLVDVDP